jgi:hypothetical protein
MVENATDYKYSSAMCHAGLVNNSLVTDYDIGVLPSEYQDYFADILGVKGSKRGRYPFLGLPLFLKLKSLPTLSHFIARAIFFPLHLMSNILIMALLMLKIIQLRQKW